MVDSGVWVDRRVMVFAGQHDTHKETGEDYDTRTLASIFTMEPGEKPKSAGLAFIPSTYRDYDGREHKIQRERGSYVTLTGDIDQGDHALERIETLVRAFAGDSAWLIYSSPHALPGDMRWRVLLPLDQPTSFDIWHDAQHAFFDFMELAGVKMDRALDRAAQPVYLPNVPVEHVKSGERLRTKEGAPLHYQRSSSGTDAVGLRLDDGVVAKGIKDIVRRRAEADRERERIRVEAERKRANRPKTDQAKLIDGFNESTSIVTLLELYGYHQSPRHAEDWHSPLQTGDTYATRIMGDKWVSLSSSDADAGLGSKCASGCYGDAYDLYAHFEHRGDHTAAFRQLGTERRDARPSRSNVVRPHFWTEPPPEVDDDPGYQEMPDWADVEAEASAPIGEIVPAGGASNNVSTEPFECPPADLWARYEAPALPADILPPVIERYAVAHSETMGTDPAGLAMAALTVCAAAIPDSIRLQVKRYDPTWFESARIWVTLVGTPSTKKSPIMNAAIRPLNKIDTDLFRAYMAKKDEYDALDAKDRKSAPKPVQRRVRISDATVEAAQEVLKDSPDGVLSQQDELSGWFGAMDKYAAGKGAMADRGFWLQAFNGGPYALNRVARGAALIPKLSISILGGIQPDPLRRIVSESVDDGLIQRLLPVLLKPAVLGRDEPQDGSVRLYEELVPRLWRLSPSAFLGGSTDLQFSDEAQEVRRRLEVRHLEMAQAEVISPKMGSHFGKYDGIFARLCVLWHCIEHIDARPMPGTISAGTTQRVETFLHRFIVPSAIAFYSGILGLSDDHDTLIELAGYILTHRLETVQHRDCQRATSTLKALAVEQTRRLFEKLESFAWLEPIDPPKNSKTPRWRVNPDVHEIFAERGRSEKARRERARASIASVFQPEER